MSGLTITILYDNCKAQDHLQEGWGFSALIQTPSHNILFDTGNDQEAFFSNAEKLGIDLQTITDVFFSHKHDDHVAGCETILTKLKPNTRIFVPKGFPKKKIPKTLPTQFLSGLTKIDEGIYSQVQRAGFFLYEQALILETGQGLVIITGCAHPGIIEIVKTAQESLQKPIYLVLGGFHLFRESVDHVQGIVEKFKALNVQNVAPCHCSGDKTIDLFEKSYPNHFHKIGTGSSLSL